MRCSRGLLGPRKLTPRCSHSALRREKTFCCLSLNETVFTLYFSPHLQKHTLHYTIHPLSHSQTAVIHVRMCSLYSRILQKKNIFMNQITKTHVPGFRIKQRAGNEWESRQSWPRPFLALLLPSGLLGPKRTFRKSSQCREGPSQSLHPLRGQKHIKKGLQEQGCLHRMLQNPRLCPLNNACERSEMLIFHARSPPIHLLQLT